MKPGQVLTAMVTPMQADKTIDAKQAAKLAKHLADQGTDGLVVCGTTGESPTLSTDEKLAIYKEVVDAVGSRVEVIAGTGSYDTAESLRLTKAAEKTGVDGIMLVTPYYNKPSQEGLYQHFRTIAAASSLPVMLYNVPSRTSANLLPETVARLARDVDNIQAIKEANADIQQISLLRELTPNGFLIYAGDDFLTLPMLALGGSGVVSIAGHLVGRRIQEMIKSFFRGDWKEALAIHQELMPLFRTLFLTTNPVPVKRALTLTGFPTGPVRLPLVELTEDEEQTLHTVLKQFGLLE